MPSLSSLMCGGDPYDFPYADFDDFEGIDDPDHEDRRKDWLENYAAEEAGYHPVEWDELPC